MAIELGMTVHTCNVHTWEQDAENQVFKSSLDTKVQGQGRLNEIILKKVNKKI